MIIPAFSGERLLHQVGTMKLVIDQVLLYRLYKD